jgi:AcrR family transcriptional regulator
MPAPPASTATPVRRRQPRMPIEVRREQVLDAAMRLITKHGYSAASMEAIAREAKLAKPRIYAAYPDRGLLLMALLEREQDRIIAALADAMPQFDPELGFDNTLVAAMTNLLGAVRSDPEPWQLLIAPADEAPPSVRAHADAGRAYALERLRELLEWGLSARPALEELDVELAAYTLLAAGEQAVKLVLANPDTFTAERYQRFARSILAAL